MDDATKARYFLRRFVAQALYGAGKPQNLHVDANGWASIAQLLGIARAAALKEGVNPLLLTSDLVQQIAVHSGGTIESNLVPASVDDNGNEIPEKPATMVRGATRDRPPAVAPKSPSIDETVSQIDKSAKADAVRELAIRQKRVEARQAEALSRTKAAYEARLAKEKEAKARATAAALSDPKNGRRIADPKDPTKLAQIAPPLKRLQPGS